MKKDSKDMITSFKLFESISSEGVKPAYLMTLSEYNEKVSPVLKEFTKWIKKNLQYYIVWDYSFINYITWNDFKEKELESFRRNKYSLGVEYIQKRWREMNGVEPEENIPDSVSKQFKEYKDFFSVVFGNTLRVDSDEVKSNKRAIKRAFENDTYLDMLRDGKITVDELTRICDSAGVKVQSGVLKKANVKPVVKKEDGKTPEEVTKIFNSIIRILTEFTSRKIEPYSLVTRMTRTTYGISYATISSFKFIVDNWKYLSDEQKEYINKTFPNYMYKIKEFTSKEEQKRTAENISYDEVLGPIIKQFKEGIQPMVDEQKEKINNGMRGNLSRILKDYETMTGSEFDKRYGDRYEVKDPYTRKPTGEIKYSMNQFWGSLYGRLIRMKDLNEREKVFSREILTAQNEYQAREHEKIEALFGRLRMKYPDLVDFKLEKPKRGVNGIEYFMTAYDKKGVIYNISTETIYAGGYNIQRLHLRWLMSVYCGGERVAIFKSGEE